MRNTLELSGQLNEEKVFAVEDEANLIGHATPLQDEMLTRNNEMWKAKMDALEGSHRNQTRSLEATIAHKEEYHHFF